MADVTVIETEKNNNNNKGVLFITINNIQYTQNINKTKTISMGIQL